MDTGDPYVVLGVARDATNADIKRAYDAKVNAAARSGSVGVVQRIDAAYEVLRNPHRRRVYDTTGATIHVPRIAYEGARVTPGRNWSPADTAPRRRTATAPRLLSITAALLTAAIVVTGWRLGVLPHGSESAAQVFAGDFAGVTVRSGDHPPVQHTRHPKRLLPRVIPPAGSGGYTLIDSSVVTPMHWDPCRPIGYVVAGAEPWRGATSDLKSAIRDVSADTGLAFVDAGVTDEKPEEQRPSYQPGRYGRRWPPVLIAWSDPTSDPKLAGSVAGYAGPTGAYVNGQPRYVSGTVSYDGPQLAAMRADARAPLDAREVLLHELGHLVGLGHVNDHASVMAPSTGDIGEFSDGDLRGLAAMGSGACFTSG